MALKNAVLGKWNKSKNSQRLQRADGFVLRINQSRQRAARFRFVRSNLIDISLYSRPCSLLSGPIYDGKWAHKELNRLERS